MIARVFGVFMTLVLAAISLGALVTAPLLDATSLDTTLLVYSVGVSALVIVAYPRTRLVDREMTEKLAALAPRISALEGLGIFASASRTALERLAAAAEEATVPGGTRIIQEGDPADFFYVITDGTVSVSAVGELGQEQPLRTMGRGEYFGEIGLLEQGPRTASVDATTDVTLLKIPGDDFVSALSETAATSAFMEGARMRLARTHPSRDLTATALQGPEN
jgi:CRP-like cAMP-binding protein